MLAARAKSGRAPAGQGGGARGGGARGGDGSSDVLAVARAANAVFRPRSEAQQHVAPSAGVPASLVDRGQGDMQRNSSGLSPFVYPFDHGGPDEHVQEPAGSGSSRIAIGIPLVGVMIDCHFAMRLTGGLGKSIA